MNQHSPASSSSPSDRDESVTNTPPPHGRWLTWWKLPLILATGIAIADQITKWLVIERIPLHSDIVIVPHFFHLVHLRNTGAAWGMMRGQTQMLAFLSIIVFGFILWKFHQLAEGRRERALSLGLILGGILGNLIDRLLRGEVVDFLLFYYRSFQWPAFNVADSAICIGVAVFIFSSLFHDHHDTCHHEASTR